MLKNKNTILLPFVALFVLFSVCAAQEPAEEQQPAEEISQESPDLTDEEVQDNLAKINTLITDGGLLFKKESYSRSAKKIRTAKTLMIELVADGKAETLTKLEYDYGRLSKAQELLIANGEEFDDMVPLAEMGKLWVPEEKTKPSKDKDNDAEPVSFTKDIAPILMKKCAKCHVEEAKGGFSAANFESLKKGGKKGKVFEPGDPSTSSMFTLVKDKKMPPKSKGFPKKDLEKIEAWISQGAKYDGQDETEDLAKLAGNNGRSGPSR